MRANIFRAMADIADEVRLSARVIFGDWPRSGGDGRPLSRGGGRDASGSDVEDEPSFRSSDADEAGALLRGRTGRMDVVHLAFDNGRQTRAAVSGATARRDRHAVSLGQIEERGAVRVPRNRLPRPAERDRQLGACRHGHGGGARRSFDGRGTKGLEANIRFGDAPRRETGGEGLHERARTTGVIHVVVGGKQLLEEVDAYAPSVVEIPPRVLLGQGVADANLQAHIGVVARDPAEGFGLDQFPGMPHAMDKPH